MDEAVNRRHRATARQDANRAFVERLYRRRPELRPKDPEAGGMRPEAAAAPQPEIALETIVRRERPVLLVKDDWVIAQDADLSGSEARDLFDMLDRQVAMIRPLMPLVGRIDVIGFPGSDFVGTGWFVDADIVVTNRHVAELIARRDGRRFSFARGVGGAPMQPSLSTTHEFDDVDVDPARSFEVVEVLYIEPEGQLNDIAFLRVDRQVDGRQPFRIDVAAADVSEDMPVCAIGYPARAPKSVIPDQALMQRLYHGRYDIKRAAPGYTMTDQQGLARHDCTTLGGNSGSVVLDIKTGKAVGLHFAGLYEESNYAVRASVLRDYITRRRWAQPIAIESGATAGAIDVPVTAVSNGPTSITIPFSVTVTVGTPSVTPAGGNAGGAGAAPEDLPRVEAALRSFWRGRAPEVLAARIGFDAADERIGERPHIAASVLPSQLSAAAALPGVWDGVPVRYYAATVDEQLDQQAMLEAVGQIAYDDDARTGKGFTFGVIDDEEIEVIAHVGPEYSWSVLQKFLTDDGGDLVSAMYEFHGRRIKEALEGRLDGGAGLTLVLDIASFHEAGDPAQGFDQDQVFEDWRRKFGAKFERVTVPEGRKGLIANAYHIKVTVRGDNQFWLSSGNWKMDSSQPVVTQAQLDNAQSKDLEGNREWHVVMASKTLAKRFRNHIMQDLKRSRALIAASEEAPQAFVEVLALEEGIVLERRAPSHILKPKTFAGKISVKPLLTPDQQGAVYSDAVLELIESATDSLLFQIPYISMPSNPTASRGFIDELIDALAKKLKSLRDARLLLRSGGAKLSSPSHTAWYLKSRGVDIDTRMRRIENHHTKGMIVDGKRLLLGSHNWSQPGVTLNRDASLLFDHEGLAQYYAEAFEVDWARANAIPPKEHRKFEATPGALEAVGPTFSRVPVSAIRTDEWYS